MGGKTLKLSALAADNAAMDTYFVSFVIFLGLLALVCGWGIVVYNRLVRLRNRVDGTWADVDVQLQRRHDLVPNLVAVVRAMRRTSAARLTK